MMSNSNRAEVHAGLLLVALAALVADAHPGHTSHNHVAPTFEITAPALPQPADKRIVLRIVDDADGRFTAARITLSLGGRRFVPEAVNEHGIRFVSIHTRKKQRATMIYARGSGQLEVVLPPGAKGGEVIVTKGYEYLWNRVAFDCPNKSTTVTVRLKRWSKIREQGWLPADEHLHYDRSQPQRDKYWLDMLAADGLTHGHFMVLKGGNLPGVWGKQHAYGKKGQATNGRALLIPGEEFRGRRQGHINLLGLGAMIEPISIGGLGTPPHPFNSPALHDVFREAQRSGGIGGPAHGGAYAPNSTAVVDTILGAAEFFEIANTHLYNTDVWYRLLNCGFIVPPAAGTDLPNFPFREHWQPLFGETRMYVRTGKQLDFESWKREVRAGRVFVSSGPIVQLSVNDSQPGGVVHLPAGGGEVTIEAELACQQPLESFEIIRNARVIPATTAKQHKAGVHRWQIRQRLTVRGSCWIAARGSGPEKAALLLQTKIRQRAMAHTAAIQVIVGNQPITSPADAKGFLSELTRHQRAYRSEAKFQSAEDRARMLSLFDQAIEKLEPQARRR